MSAHPPEPPPLGAAFPHQSTGWGHGPTPLRRGGLVVEGPPDPEEDSPLAGLVDANTLAAAGVEFDRCGKAGRDDEVAPPHSHPDVSDVCQVNDEESR